MRLVERSLSASDSSGCVDIELDLERLAIKFGLDLCQRRSQAAIQLGRDTAGVDRDTEVDLSDRSSHAARLSAWPARSVRVAFGDAHIDQGLDQALNRHLGLR